MSWPRCSAPSPTVTVGVFEFRGGPCHRALWHRGWHRNSDGSRWRRSLLPLVARVALPRIRGGGVS